MRSESVEEFLALFRLPVIAAPMTGVSGPALVAAAAGQGIGGSFPVHNASSPQVLDAGTGAAIGATFAMNAPGHPYQSFKAFPPSQRSGNMNLDTIMEALAAGAAGAGK